MAMRAIVRAIGPLNLTGAALFMAIAMIGGYVFIGIPPVVIVGGSAAAGFVMWCRTWRNGPLDPDAVLPPFLLTVAGLEMHMVEEYLTGFGPAMSRLFWISWTERGFLMVFAFIGPVLYSLTALGLYRRIRIAGFVMWFIFIGPGLAELSHFIFPLLRPALAPSDPASISAVMRGTTFVADMKNYFIGTTHRYYFPGLYTAVLPMIPGIWGIRSALRAAKGSRGPAET